MTSYDLTTSLPPTDFKDLEEAMLKIWAAQRCMLQICIHFDIFALLTQQKIEYLSQHSLKNFACIKKENVEFQIECSRPAHGRNSSDSLLTAREAAGTSMCGMCALAVTSKSLEERLRQPLARAPHPTPLRARYAAWQTRKRVGEVPVGCHNVVADIFPRSLPA